MFVRFLSPPLYARRAIHGPGGLFYCAGPPSSRAVVRGRAIYGSCRLFLRGILPQASVWSLAQAPKNSKPSGGSGFCRFGRRSWDMRGYWAATFGAYSNVPVSGDRPHLQADGVLDRFPVGRHEHRRHRLVVGVVEIAQCGKHPPEIR